MFCFVFTEIIDKLYLRINNENPVLNGEEEMKWRGLVFAFTVLLCKPFFLHGTKVRYNKRYLLQRLDFLSKLLFFSVL